MSNAGYYKFHDATYTDRLLAGEWFISSLDYFSYLALKYADEWIGDETESGIIYRGEGKLTWEGRTPPPEDAYMRSQGLLGGGPLRGITLVDPTFRKPEWPAHIISLCQGEYEQCAYAMLEEPEPLYRYNACVEISNVEGFAQALWEEGVTASGTPIRQLFKEPLLGPVIYGDREAKLSDQIPLNAGYFFKRSTYAKQSEFRIVLPHVKNWAIRDRLVFNLPRPERFLSLRLAGMRGTKTDDQLPLPNLIEETNSFYDQKRAAKALDESKRVWPPVYDPDILTEIKRISEESIKAASAEEFHSILEKNRDQSKNIQAALLSIFRFECEHSIKFEKDNWMRLRDLLWRWRLEKHMRLRSDAAYLMRPQMHCLDDLQAAITTPWAANKISHLRG